MDIDLPPLHDDLAFNAPMSAVRAQQLVEFVTGVGGRIVDIGCGWAELLLQVLEAAPGAHGTGIDVDAVAIAHGKANAQARGLADRVTLLTGEGATVAPEQADAVICIGARHVWGDDDAALAALREMVPRGGRVVYGEGIWSRPPDAAAFKPFGGSPDAYGFLADLVDVAVAQGFRPLSIGEASQHEWDAFESGYSAGYERWLQDHPPSEPSAAQVRQMADQHRQGYLRGYRGVFGFAYLGLVAA